MFCPKFRKIVCSRCITSENIGILKNFLHQIAHHRQSLKFDIKYPFRIFDENFNDLKPVESVGKEYHDRDPVFIFPGFEGKINFVRDLIRNLQRRVYCFQYPFEKSPTNASIIAKQILPFLSDFAQCGRRINIVAHSFGGVIALTAIKNLPCEDQVRLCLIDSTPYAVKFMLTESFGNFERIQEVQNNLLTDVLQSMNVGNLQMFDDIIDESTDWESKLRNFVKKLPEHPKFNKWQLHQLIDAIYRVLLASVSYDETSGKFNVKTSLICSSEKVLPFPDDFREAEYFMQPTRTLYVQGHHFNVLRFPETADRINEELDA